jgi:hypothetical protein
LLDERCFGAPELRAELIDFVLKSSDIVVFVECRRGSERGCAIALLSLELKSRLCSMNSESV